MEHMLDHLKKAHNKEFDISDYPHYYHRLPDEIKQWIGKM